MNKDECSSWWWKCIRNIMVFMMQCMIQCFCPLTKWDFKQAVLDIDVHMVVLHVENKKQNKRKLKSGTVKGWIKTLKLKKKHCQAAVERTDTHDWVHTKQTNKRSPLSPCNQWRNRQGRAGFSSLSPGWVWGPMLVFQGALPNGSTHQSL